MYLSSVRPSVCLSVCLIGPPHAAAAGLLLWAQIDCCTAGAQQQPRRSSSVRPPNAGCGQCHVVS